MTHFYPGARKRPSSRTKPTLSASTGMETVIKKQVAYLSQKLIVYEKKRQHMFAAFEEELRAAFWVV